MSLNKHFNKYLNAGFVGNDALRKEAYKLRYQIYCEERGYENPAEFPNNEETDRYDKHSVHAVVRYRETNKVAGVVRLVFPHPLNPDNPLPIESHCSGAFYQDVLGRFKFARKDIAEVSRFAVSNRLIGEAGSLDSTFLLNAKPDQGHIPDDSSRCFPHISLGLIAMLFVASFENQITHWYAFIQPSLSRLLTRSGIEFTPIGPIVDYNGNRQPMIANVKDLLRDIYQTRYDFFELIEEQCIKEFGKIPDELVEIQAAFADIMNSNNQDKLECG